LKLYQFFLIYWANLIKIRCWFYFFFFIFCDTLTSKDIPYATLSVKRLVVGREEVGLQNYALPPSQLCLTKIEEKDEFVAWKQNIYCPSIQRSSGLHRNQTALYCLKVWKVAYFPTFHSSPHFAPSTHKQKVGSVNLLQIHISFKNNILL
jgi:hypothetical protein